MNIFRAIIIAIFVSVSASAACAECSYSAYVDFGPAMTDGNLDKKENVYRSSGLIKNIRTKNPSKNFRAVYSSYMDVKAGDFEIINIGPFDTEAVAYTELNKVISDLTNRGFKPRTKSHSMPAVLINNKNPC